MSIVLNIKRVPAADLVLVRQREGKLHGDDAEGSIVDVLPAADG